MNLGIKFSFEFEKGEKTVERAPATVVYAAVPDHAKKPSAFVRKFCPVRVLSGSSLRLNGKVAGESSFEKVSTEFFNHGNNVRALLFFLWPRRLHSILVIFYYSLIA